MSTNSFNDADAREFEEAIYQRVLDEIAAGIKRDGLWAKAIAESGGSIDAAKARYIQLRAQSMMDDIARAQSRSTKQEPPSAGKATVDLPPGVKGWSWGAFLLNWIWALGNKTWWGTLALVPYLGFLVALYLGFKGRELAWRNNKWDSYEAFDAAQKRWSFWGVTITSTIFIVGIGAAVAIPAYQDYKRRALSVVSQPVEQQHQAPAQIATEEEERRAHFEAIYSAHPDARQIIESPEFRNWLARNDVWAETAKSGTASQVISMFNSFKSEPSLVRGTLAQPQQPSNPPINYAQPDVAERAQPFGSRDEVKAALRRARADYPYLATAQGKPVVNLILRHAEDLVQREGYHAGDAVTFAAREIAPSHEPAANHAAPATQAANAESEHSSDGQNVKKSDRPCRMVSASPISFQCD